MKNGEPKYKRILLKLSGEALASGAEDSIFNYKVLDGICGAIKKLTDMGVQVAIVVGAGNIWRGRQGTDMERTTADHMGMLATVINSLALQDSLRRLGADARSMTAIAMPQFAEFYARDKAVHHLEKGRVVILGCGTGNPFFSTDTGAMLRAAEIGADVVMMGKNIDGVYTADPKKDPTAKRLDEISYMEILEKGLKVIDSTAASFGDENKMPLYVFGIDDPENIIKAVNGEKVGTFIS